MFYKIPNELILKINSFLYYSNNKIEIFKNKWKEKIQKINFIIKPNYILYRSQYPCWYCNKNHTKYGCFQYYYDINKFHKFIK